MAIVGAFVGGWFLHGSVFLHAQTDPWGIGFLIGVGIAAAVGFWYLQAWRSVRVRRRLRDAGWRPDRSWVAPVAILAVFASYGFVSANNARDAYVRPYCLYGAKSQAQLDGCMSHVTNEDINALNTQAARFGRGDTSDCLDDSGPFCASAAEWNSLDPGDYQ